MEKLKKLEELHNPDKRNLVYGVIDRDTGEQRSLDVTDIYSSVEAIDLSAKVPESIRSQFNVAKNLAIYSWFSYSFHQTAEMKAFSTVEMALKDRLGKHKYGLKRLIKRSVDVALIKDSGFSHIAKPENPNSTEYSQDLPKIMSSLRNSLAHGSTMLHPFSVDTLVICADFINQLYENEFDKQIQPTAKSSG